MTLIVPKEVFKPGDVYVVSAGGVYFPRPEQLGTYSVATRAAKSLERNDAWIVVATIKRDDEYAYDYLVVHNNGMGWLYHQHN